MPGRLPALLFAVATAATLVSGRLTFALGAAAAVAAVLAATRGRPVPAALGGLITALCSPVAGLFAALCGAALVAGDLARRRGARSGAAAPPRAGGAVPTHPGERHPGRAGLLLAAGALAPVLALAVAFPEGGTFPFAVSAFLPAFAAGVAVAVVARDPALRAGGALYALLCLGALVVPSPVGGNAARLGTLLAAPLAAVLLLPRRRVAFALLLAPLAYWVLQPAVRDWRRAGDDPSVEARFHRPLADALKGRGPLRVEVPFTQSHGEAWHLAGGRDWVPIARGWNRQLDRERNGLFYDDTPPTAARYRRWLDDNAIAYVASPGGLSLDASGEAEAELVQRGLPYLRDEGQVGAYRLYRVRDARPLATGAARLIRLDPEGFALTGSKPGTTEVRVRFSPYWAVLAGPGCVEPGPGGWTRVRTRRPGDVTVGMRFALRRVRATSPRCTD